MPLLLFFNSRSNVWFTCAHCKNCTFIKKSTYLYVLCSQGVNVPLPRTVTPVQEGPIHGSSWAFPGVTLVMYMTCGCSDVCILSFSNNLTFLPVCTTWTSLVAQTVKNPPAMPEMQVWSLAREDPLEEEMATHSSILAWRVPMDRGAWQATVQSQTRLSD